jgi:hypothetical protein
MSNIGNKSSLHRTYVKQMLVLLCFLEVVDKGESRINLKNKWSK